MNLISGAVYAGEARHSIHSSMGMTSRTTLEHATQKRRSRRIHRDCTLPSPPFSLMRYLLLHPRTPLTPLPHNRTRATKSPAAPSSTARRTSSSPASPSFSTTSSFAATSCANNPNPPPPLHLPPQIPKTPKTDRKSPTPSPSIWVATSSSRHTVPFTRPPACPPRIPLLPPLQPQQQIKVSRLQPRPNLLPPSHT